jgi:hypothetical protein
MMLLQITNYDDEGAVANDDPANEILPIMAAMLQSMMMVISQSLLMMMMLLLELNNNDVSAVK